MQQLIDAILKNEYITFTKEELHDLGIWLLSIIETLNFSEMIIFLYVFFDQGSKIFTKEEINQFINFKLINYINEYIENNDQEIKDIYYKYRIPLYMYSNVQFIDEYIPIINSIQKAYVK